MKVYTIQDKVVLDILEMEGSYKVDKNKSQYLSYSNSYDKMLDIMSDKLGVRRYPIWTFSLIQGYEPSTDINWKYYYGKGANITENSILIELDVDENNAVIMDYYNWTDYMFYIQCDDNQSADESLKYLFDLSEADTIQVCIPEITKDMIQNVYDKNGNKIYLSEKIYIYTDAASYNNGYRNTKDEPMLATSAVVVKNSNGKILHKSCVSLYDTTNNRGEAYALYKGLLYASELKKEGYDVTVISDSKICVCGVRDWAHKWKLNGDIWYSSSGSEVVNQDILKKCHKLMMEYNIPIYHIRGHITNSKKLNKAMNTFNKLNKFNGKISKEKFMFHKKGNDDVDKLATSLLDKDYFKNNRKRRKLLLRKI